MHRKTDEKTTYDYNIYKIPVEKSEDFKKFLSERSFDEIELKKDLIQEANGFNFDLMFCDKDNRKGSPWVKLLSSCSEEDLTQKNIWCSFDLYRKRILLCNILWKCPFLFK